MQESGSFKRARRSALAFSTAIRIGILAVLGCLVLLLVSGFRTAPSVYWKLCFSSCVLALGALVLGHVTLAWNSPGYEFDGSISVSLGSRHHLRFGSSQILAYLFWLLILCGFVSAAFGFTERTRLIVLFAFGVLSLVSVALTPLFHVGLVDSFWRGIWGNKP